ncbi:MAG: long-chain fatty acid--CoA ligase [Candidatus Bathyarchaeota archaeon]|nr:long-chain fatty acid--CoA ligase [Candidatus Bathyarchaeota archaeon]
MSPQKKTLQHLEYPKVPLSGLLEANAKNFPDHVAIAYCANTLTYAQLDILANQFANALSTLGAKKGDCVALYLPNIPQFVISYFGALKIGGVVTTISPLHREREVEYQLCDSGAQTIVTLDSLFPIVEKVREKTPLKNVITTGLNDYDTQTSPSPSLPNTFSFRQLLLEASSSHTSLKFDPAVDLAALQYTGGTTGTPKAAMLTHRNLVSNAVAFAATIKGTSQDVFLTALPLFHIYGLTTSLTVPISLGAKMVLLSKFEPVKTLTTIQQEHVSVFCGVPTMYTMLINYPDLGNYDLKSVRVCISGASALPPQVQRSFMEVTGGFLAEGYGLSEASPVTHCSPVDKALALRVGSIGLPLPDTEAKIVDAETGVPLGVGQRGELAVRGPQVMAGYWHRPDETAQVLRDGWLLTGDIARIDADGYCYIVDRKKDLIKYKDYSVYPRELEDLLYEHPAVKQCAVVGKPDPKTGEIPVAYIVLKDGVSATAEEIKGYVNAKVAAYKAIRDVVFLDALPLTAAGKVLKRALKERA